MKGVCVKKRQLFGQKTKDGHRVFFFFTLRSVLIGIQNKTTQESNMAHYRNRIFNLIGTMHTDEKHKKK